MALGAPRGITHVGAGSGGSIPSAAANGLEATAWLASRCNVGETPPTQGGLGEQKRQSSELSLAKVLGGYRRMESPLGL